GDAREIVADLAELATPGDVAVCSDFGLFRVLRFYLEREPRAKVALVEEMPAERPARVWLISSTGVRAEPDVAEGYSVAATRSHRFVRLDELRLRVGGSATL